MIGLRTPDEQDRDDRYAEAFEARVAERANALLTDPLTVSDLHGSLDDWAAHDAAMAALMQAVQDIDSDAAYEAASVLRDLLMPHAIREATRQIEADT